jgi:REP element-mobilizing transposase RayT
MSDRDFTLPIQMRTKLDNDGQRCWVMPTPKPKNTHGGKRRGAGRKPTNGSRERGHHARAEVDPRHPQHVVLRVRDDVGRLRHAPIYAAVRSAIEAAADEAAFRIVHFSVQGNHLHFLVEAASSAALTEGMRELAKALAAAINASLGRTGKVFAGRYHPTAITTPTQARNALAYVLNNWRKHDEDERSPETYLAPLDPYSSAIMFDGWKELGRVELPAYLEPCRVQAPRTWLLTVGWRKAKRPISMFATPGLDERP